MFPTTLTLSGIESYWNEHGQSLFGDVLIPEGIDRETMTAFIISRAGDFSVVDFDPEYMMKKTDLWFKANYDDFDRWLKAFMAQYDPLYDYWRQEDEAHTDHNAGVVNVENTITGSSTTNSSSSSSGNVEDKTSAFNSSTYSPEHKTETSDSGTTGSTGSNTSRSSGSNYDTRNSNGEYHKTIKGRNTKVQELIKDEMELRESYNIYDMISTLYIREFCLPIYG